MALRGWCIFSGMRNNGQDTKKVRFPSTVAEYSVRLQFSQYHWFSISTAVECLEENFLCQSIETIASDVRFAYARIYNILRYTPVEANNFAN